MRFPPQQGRQIPLPDPSLGTSLAHLVQGLALKTEKPGPSSPFSFPLRIGYRAAPYSMRDEQIETGERAACLLKATAVDEAAKIDRCKAGALD